MGLLYKPLDAQLPREGVEGIVRSLRASRNFFHSVHRVKQMGRVRLSVTPSFYTLYHKEAGHDQTNLNICQY